MRMLEHLKSIKRQRHYVWGAVLIVDQATMPKTLNGRSCRSNVIPCAFMPIRNRIYFSILTYVRITG